MSYNTTDPYGLSPHYWHIFAARLAFVVVFEHVVFVITAIMQFLIPDIPVELKTQIQREQLLAKEAKYQNGLNRARENEYEDLLSAIRDNNSATAIPGPTPARSNVFSRNVVKSLDILICFFFSSTTKAIVAIGDLRNSAKWLL